MQCYTELIPPTAVTHAISLPFLGPRASNLVVAKTSLLQVFNVVTSNPDNAERLVLVGEYELAGTLTSIASVKTLDTKTGGEALLLAFKNAKLSLIEWDPENHRTSTISIHYYEADNVTAQPFGVDFADADTILTVDPGSRCAALKFGVRQLAILPFRQHGDELGVEEEAAYDADAQPSAVARRESIQQNGEVEQTPYKASFVLPLTALDPSLSHTVHMAFLHEYREPTFGILSSSVEPSYALLDERKDILTYTVYTLDLEQRASTNLITVPKLPTSLWKVIPLALPVGGALLVGTNELVHIDQSGKANATAVNEFAKLESEFGMVDQSSLHLKLENCSVDVLDTKTGEMLLVLHDGSLATLNFETMGRSVSSIVVSRVTEDRGGDVINAAPSCMTSMSGNNIFVGSEDGPSSLLSWNRPAPTLSRKRSHAQMLGPDGDPEDEDAIEEEDDDLYDAAPATGKRALSSAGLSASEMAAVFSLQDVLPTIGPINDICIAKSTVGNEGKLQLLLGSGRGRSSRLTSLSRGVLPQISQRREFESIQSAWSIRAAESDIESTESGFDNLLFVYDGQNTKPYDITQSEETYIARDAQDFEGEGETVGVGTLANGTIIVHCRRSEVRTYDAKLALSQIIPMIDDETDEEFNIVHVSFCDPYLLVLRDDSSIQILAVQGNEIEPLEGPNAAVNKKWLSGCVYSGSLNRNEPTAFLLNADGGMEVFSLPDMEPVLSTPLLAQLPPVLSADISQRRPSGKEALTELLIADLGQKDISQPYMIIRTSVDDVIIYEPFYYHIDPLSNAWHGGLRFRKVPIHYLPRYNDSEVEQDNSRPPSMSPTRIGNQWAVSIPGASPCLLLKEPSSLPKILEVKLPAGSQRITSLSTLRHPSCEDGFLAIGADELLDCRLDADSWHGTGWSVKHVDLGHYAREIRHLAYHETRHMYVVATCRDVDFYFADEDGRHQEQDDISLRPQVPQYSIHLISTNTNRVIHTFEMPYQETVTALQIMPLEVSENTHEQQLRIVVSTASQRGEDMPAKGAVTVFDILDVVPEPDILESGFKLHIVAREETRGAITAIAPFTGGFIGTAQGQKIMIRGLKEDGSCLPVAFLDARCYTSTIKTLPNRGLWLAGDAWKGLWFGGFTEEPYRLIKLATTPATKMEVMSAEFLPYDGSLYILIADANMDLHVLQYDPENPKTQGGMRLLHRSTFHIGHFPTTMTLLPSTLAPSAQQTPLTNGTSNEEAPAASSLYHVLTTTLSGSIGLITPLDESAYRRLSTLQNHLTSILEHAAGLNPRAYRGVGVVNGSLVQRISELGAARRGDVLARSGADVWTLKSDLEIVGGGGLAYL